MTKPRFVLHESHFLKGAVFKKDFPDHESFEFALLGRSNVGKSTLLNRLTGTRKLAKTSKTPGRTQEINFFEVKASLDKEKFNFLLSDLPGYGFAKIAPQKKKDLEQSIFTYVTKREPLSVVALLIDCRRGPQAEELYLRDLIFSHDITVLPVLTKVDKLSKNQLAKAIKDSAAILSLEPGDLETTGTKIPIERLWIKLLDAR